MCSLSYEGYLESLGFERRSKQKIVAKVPGGVVDLQPEEAPTYPFIVFGWAIRGNASDFVALWVFVLERIEREWVFVLERIERECRD